jgi:steroid 5-alpha reductase family enzyme
MAGWIGLTALFLFVSLPMIETRMIERRADYREVQAVVSTLVPWFQKLH